MLVAGELTRSRLGRTLCKFLGSVCLFVSADTTADATLPPVIPDPRIDKLQGFFQAYGCPEPHHIEDYLRAADVNGLDYRLLPAISIRESTCGIHAAARNNFWGWDSARSGFKSVKAGIEFIASQLAFGRPYRDKTIHQKLRTYNPRKQYAPEILTLMQQIDNLPASE